MEERVHRRQRQDIGKRRPLQPELIGPVVMPQRHRGQLQLRVRGIADLRIEKILIAGAHHEFLITIIIAPACSHLRAGSLVAQFRPLGIGRNGKILGGNPQFAPRSQKRSIALFVLGGSLVRLALVPEII